VSRIRGRVTWLGGPCPLGCLVTCLVCSACQNEYPIEPTPCDDWCHATETCGWSDPADCVDACEEQGLTPQSPECRARWDEAIGCFNAAPEGAVCRTMTMASGDEQDCSAEREAVWECASRERFE